MTNSQHDRNKVPDHAPDSQAEPCDRAPDSQAEPCDRARYCKRCNKLMPADSFRPGSNRSLCHTHLKEEQRQQVLGTLDRRAFNSLRCRSRKDLEIFNQKALRITRKDVIAMLTADQLARYSQWCIVPRDPLKTLTPANAAVISSLQRRYLICHWKFKRDPDAYARELAQLLETTQNQPLRAGTRTI